MTSLDHIIAEIESTGSSSVSLVGICWDGSSSFLKGAAAAPDKIRQAIRSSAGNLFSESGIDLSLPSRLAMPGDLNLPPNSEPFETIEDSTEQILNAGAKPIFLGGDHSITLATAPACARKYQDLTVVHFDAHPDLYDEFQGSRTSHACPMARVLERDLISRLVQIGIRAGTAEQKSQAARFGVETISAARIHNGAALDLELTGPLYVSFDLDVLDPAFAPGVSHPEPGGLSTRTAISIIQSLPGPVVCADIVELNPSRDPADLTAGVAAKIAKELAAKMLDGVDR